jgi:hypothetical protein
MISPRTALRAMIAIYSAVVVAGAVIIVESADRTEAAPNTRATVGRARPDNARLGVTRRLSGQVALYPRAIRLSHSGTADGRVLVSVVSHNDGNGTGEIYQSTDGGETFAHLGTIADPKAAHGLGLCCGSLYELPRPSGGLAAGTLLWAASAGQSATRRRMTLRVWRSADHGRTWSFLSSGVTARGTGGLWEPELSLDAGGALVCHFSDETRQGHSQVLARIRSVDGGRTWSRPVDTVVAPNPDDRAGMAVVRELPYGIYVMTYELCTRPGPSSCVVHLRTSADGWHWDGPDTVPRTEEGAHLEHAPTVAWTPGDGMYGRLLLVGQVLTLDDGEMSPVSGRVLLTNDRRGDGPWKQVTAPLATPVPARDACSNYSSALLPSADGTTVLEVGTRYDRDNICRAYYATAGVR